MSTKIMKSKIMVVGMLLVGLMASACGKIAHGGDISQQNTDNQASSKSYADMTEDELSTLCEGIYDDYNNQEITYEQANEQISQILDALPVGEQRDNVYKWNNDLEDLHASKTAYDNASQKVESEDIEDTLNAMDDFKKVIEEDTLYSDAQEQIDNLAEKYYTTRTDDAQNQIEKGNYTTAIGIYKDVKAKLGSYKDIEELLENVQKTYCDSIIYEAEYDMLEGKFEAATRLVNNAIDEIGEKEELVAELERIEYYTPVNLMDVDTFYTEDDINTIVDEWDASMYDNVGNTGNKGIYFSGSMNHEACSAWLLDKKYDTLTGIFALDEYYKDKTDFDNYKCQLVIYGDGELLYTSEYMYGGIKPIEVNIDISNVDELKLGVKFEGWNVVGVGFLNPTVKNEFTLLDELTQDESVIASETDTNVDRVTSEKVGK